MRAFLAPVLVSIYSGCVASMASSKTYDMVVVGGGAAGLTAAKLAGQTLKKSVAIVESDRMGGDCTWTGCVPSKSLLAAAKSVHTARKYGILQGKPDYAKIRQTIAASIDEIYTADDSPEALSKLGVDVVTGSASLSSPSSVEVKFGSGNGITLNAKEGIVLSTGAFPRVPNIDGLQSVPFLTTETIWSMEKLPNRLTVVGGGPVGCELAQAFSRLGAKVTIIAHRLLPKEDPAVENVLTKVFEKEGIEIAKGRAIAVAAKGPTGHTVTLSGEDSRTVHGDVLLIALGRVPRTEGMGLKEAGIKLNEAGGFAIDKKLQTSVKGVYAAGFQGAIAARNILLPLSDPGVLENVPATTFTSPEVASVGMTEQEAIEQHGKDKVIVSLKQMSHVDRAICEGETDGFLKVIFMKKSGKIVGATLVAPTAGEMLSEISVAMETGMSFDKLAKVMHAYPSYSMALQLMAADVYYENTMKLKPVYDVLKKVGL